MPEWVEPGGYAPAFGGGSRTRRDHRADTPSGASPPPEVSKVFAPPPLGVAQPVPGAAAKVAHLASAAAPELFTRIAERGVRGVSNRDVTEEILSCRYQIAVVGAITDGSSSWVAKCVRPPFQTLWLEYPYLDMLCGAFITEMGSAPDVYKVRFVTSSTAERTKPRLWRIPEIAELAGDGRLARRACAFAGARNSVAEQQWDTLEHVFDLVYPHLAILNEIHSRVPTASILRGGLRASLLAEPHELGTVVLVWGDDDAAGAGSSLATARHAPVSHPVRGHPRRLSDGRTTWVHPYVTGGGSSADPATPRVYQVRHRGPTGTDEERSPEQ
jgi:hypothetical protein